jgi:hypothetical protein
VRCAARSRSLNVMPCPSNSLERRLSNLACMYRMYI